MFFVWPTILLMAFSGLAIIRGFSARPLVERTSNSRLTVPRFGLLSGHGFGPVFDSDTFTSRHMMRRRICSKTSNGRLRLVHKYKFVPRSGLMIAGRGFQPGFMDSTQLKT